MDRKRVALIEDLKNIVAEIVLDAPNINPKASRGKTYVNAKVAKILTAFEEHQK